MFSIVFREKEVFIDKNYQYLFKLYKLYYANNYIRFCPNTKCNGKFKGELLHRVIYALEYGVIIKSQDVHHINENTLDNRVNNLLAMSRSDHMCIHMKGENSPSWGKKQTEEHVEKRIGKLRGRKILISRQGQNAPNFGKVHSKASKAKMSEARKVYWAKRREASV